MANKNEVICIQCPVACRIEVLLSDSGAVEKVTGFQCKEGKEYAPQECQSPRRVLTTTVRTESSARPVLPVRSRGTVPKGELRDCVQMLATMKVKPPLKMGDVIVSNIMGTGADIICTDDLAT
ncbi:MAG: DUF1667 domain-containing protein [Dehalococcoidia bacterium]|nr:DUF1667 domain-containing protein [Dehalococcoidia bacterium]